MIIDPIGDMLTRIRNANALRYETVSCPHSKLKEEIAKISGNSKNEIANCIDLKQFCTRRARGYL